MKVKILAQILVFVLLMASGSRPVSADMPQPKQHSTGLGSASSQCESVEAVTPGDTVTDDVSDVSAAHIDITEVSTSLSGETLTVVFHLRDVPESLTFDRTGLTEGTMEYSWEVAIDVDNDRGTGAGGFDYLLLAYHIFYQSESSGESTVPLGEIVDASTWEVHPTSFSSLEDASLEISAEADTITLTGEIPGITSESRLTFETSDVKSGSDQVECHAPYSASVGLWQCESGGAGIVPGQTVADESGDATQGHIDITEVSASLSGETLTVVFHLRDVPETLTFNRTGILENRMEYSWEAVIDVDNNMENGDGGFDYLLSAYHIVPLTEKGGNSEVPIGDQAKASIWTMEPGSIMTLEDASLEVSAEEDTITLTGDIPGITSESRLSFRTNDYSHDFDSDTVGCFSPASGGHAPAPCSSVVAIAPGDTVIDDVSDALGAHIDITEVSTSLSGETLTVVFHLREVPETLTFDRTGVPDDALEYNWEVSIDVDGSGRYEYTLAASHYVFPEDSGSDRVASITTRGIVQVNIWERDLTGATLLADASIEVSTQDKTITLSGEIPGITEESRLAFETYDYLGGSDRVGCDDSLSPDPPSNQCTSDGATITPGETMTDDVSDALAAHIDITEVSTSLSGETLTVVFHLREVPETLTFDRTGVPDDALEYKWEVSVDVDSNRETGFNGFDFALSASHFVHSFGSGSDSVVPMTTLGIVQVNTWEMAPESGRLLEDATMEVSTKDRTITLSGEIPGITAESRLAFETYDFLDGSDEVGCPTSLRPIISSSACGSDGAAAIVPGQTVTDGVSDALAAHVDITEVSTALAGETLAVIFHFRDLPESLVFDREGVSENVIEYYWWVRIDLDRNQETGSAGFDYALSASHAVQSDSEGSNAAASIGSKVQARTLEASGSGSYAYRGQASVVVSADANTITLVGDIPGITPDSRLKFEAFDHFEGSERVACQLPSLSGDTE